MIQLLYLLLFPVIISIPIISSLSTKDTSLMKMQEIIEPDFIKENGDFFLISTKDGYLHALNKDKKEIWKVYLEQELMSSLLTPRKIGENLTLYPINEQIYVYNDKSDKFISFNIFIKDLVKQHYITVNDFTLIGKTKTTVFIIDMDTGKIIQKIDDESNFSYKKGYYISKNRKTITVIRVDYILNCLGIGEEHKFWNASYSDIIIQKGNELLPDNVKVIPPNLNDIINEYKMNNINDNNGINRDNIITVYSYFNEDLPPIKIYDRSDSHIGGEMKHLSEYNNFKKLDYLDDNQMQILENLGNNNELLRLPNYSPNDYNNINIIHEDKDKNNSIFDKIMKKIKNNWYLYVIIIFLISVSIYYKRLYKKLIFKLLSDDNKIEQKKDDSEEKKEEKENTKEKKEEKEIEKEDKKNEEIIDENDSEDSMDSEDLKIKKIVYSYNETLKKKRKIKKNIINKEKEKSKSLHDNDTKGISKENNKNIEINNNNDNQEKNAISESKENSIKTKSNSSQNIEDKKDKCAANKESNGIWDDYEEYEVDDNNKENQKNTEEKNNEKNEEENDTKKSISSKKSKKISSNGIWDEDDDDDEEEEKEEKEEEKEDKEDKKEEESQKEIKSLSLKKSNSNNDDTSYDKKETAENSNSKTSKDLNDNKKEKDSMLDSLFEDFEKLGEGGFGVVLKAKHKIDNDIYAIKIIELPYNNKEREDIISEAKKMKAIKGEYIVNYSLSWYQDNLGSAEKFFEKEEDSNSDDEDNALSKSATFNIYKTVKKTLLNRHDKEKDDDIFGIKEVNEDENCDENNLDFNKKCRDCKSKKKCNNNSLELFDENKNQIYNNRSRYCFDFADDSKLLKNSKISIKYNKEISNKKEKKYLIIAMEYCDGLTLEKYINEHSNKSIERKKIYNYTKQILKCLKKLHKSCIIHRDIKPGNIFIKNDQIKIGDFGLATEFQKNAPLPTKDIKGYTPSYAAPEQTKYNKYKTYNEKVDIYAAGITLLEMCACFGTEMERYYALNDLRNKRIVSDKINNNYPEETKLIIMMTRENYNDRPSAEELLKCDVFVELGKIVNN